MSTDLSQQIEEQLALAREIVAEREADDEEARQAWVAEFREKFAPYLEALKAAIPAWVHPYIVVPEEWEPVTISIPELAPVMAYVERNVRQREYRYEVRFGLTEFDRFEKNWTWTGPGERNFAVALASAVNAQQKKNSYLESEAQEKAQPKPSKWANLDPTGKALEAIDAGEYPEASVFATIALARELRTLNSCVAAFVRDALGPAARAELDPDRAGTY